MQHILCQILHILPCNNTLAQIPCPRYIKAQSGEVGGGMQCVCVCVHRPGAGDMAGIRAGSDHISRYLSAKEAECFDRGLAGLSPGEGVCCSSDAFRTQQRRRQKCIATRLVLDVSLPFHFLISAPGVPRPTSAVVLVSPCVW